MSADPCLICGRPIEEGQERDTITEWKGEATIADVHSSCLEGVDLGADEVDDE